MSKLCQHSLLPSSRRGSSEQLAFFCFPSCASFFLSQASSLSTRKVSICRQNDLLPSSPLPAAVEQGAPACSRTNRRPRNPAAGISRVLSSIPFSLVFQGIRPINALPTGRRILLVSILSCQFPLMVCGADAFDNSANTLQHLPPLLRPLSSPPRDQHDPSSLPDPLSSF